MEFWAIPHRAKDGKDAVRAVKIRVLPPGTFAIEEETHKGVQCKVVRSPKLQRPNFGGREGGDNSINIV